jgi:hypothetical protein
LLDHTQMIDELMSSSSCSLDLELKF